MHALQQLKVMINLARIDGEVGEKEKQFLLNIGQANHLLVAEILPLFTQTHSEIIPSDLTMEQKFDYIFRLVQLMKIDEKLYRDEIRYCAKVASRLGYREDVMFELMLSVKNTPMEKNEMATLKKLIAAYL